MASFPKKWFLPECVEMRLASPFFLAPAKTKHQVLTVPQQAKANATRAEAEAAHTLALVRASCMKRRV